MSPTPNADRSPESGVQPPELAYASPSAFLRPRRLCSGVVMAIGVLALIGWAFNIGVLKSVLPTFVAMRVNTALGLIAAGYGTWTARQRERRIAGIVCGAIGLLTLFEYLSGINLGIDEILVRGKAAAPGTLAVGRMALGTAFNLVLVGAALLLLDTPTGQRGSYLPSLLAVLVGITAVLSLIGYAYGTRHLYALGAFLQLAFHTAVAFSLLAAALLCARPEQGLIAFFGGETVGWVTARRLLPGFITVMFSIGWIVIHAEEAGWLEPQMGTALHVMVAIVVATGLMSWNASTLHGIDRRRRRAEDGLREANAALEERVRKRTEELEERARELARLNGQLRETVEQQRRAEEKVQRLATIVEVSNDAIISKALDGTIITWNKGAERLYGYTEVEVLGKSIGSILAPKKADELNSLLERLRKGEELRDYWTVRHRKDGRTVHVSINLFPLRDVAGRIVGGASIGREVTKEVELERELTRGRAYNRSLIEASLDPLVTIGPGGIITDVNRAAETETGRSRERLIGTDFSAYFTDPARARAGYEQAFREGQVRDYALELRHQDGHTTPVLYNASVYRDETGSVVGVFAAARDVTVQRRLTQALEQASRYNRSLIEASLDPLVTIGPDGSITDVNTATEALTGRTRAELIGTDFAQYFTAPAQARAGYEQVFREGQVRDYALELRHQDGHTTPVLYNASVYRDETGSVVGVFAAARDVTELKRAEETLRKQAQLLDLAHDVIFVRDLEDRVTYWNRAAEKRYGWTAQEALGQVTHTLLHTTPPRPLEEIRETLLREDHWEGELQHQTRDGQQVTVDSRWSVQRDEGGRPVAILEINNDVTARKQAEAALRTSENRYRSLTVATAQVIWVTNDRGEIVEDMPYWRNYTGQTWEEIRGSGWSTAVHPDDRPKVLEVWSRAVATRSLYETEYRLRRADGEYRDVVARGVPVFTNGGAVYEWVGTCTDITARKQAETKLRLSESRFRTIFEEAPLGVAVIDSLTAHFYEVNPRFAQISGRGREEMATLDWTKITHPDDVQEDLDNMAAMNAGRIPGFAMRKRYIRPDGSWVWINMTISPLTVEDKRHPVHLCMIEDITERLQAEQALRESRERFALVVEGADVGIWDWNTATGELYFSPRWKSMLGYEDHELANSYDQWERLLHPDDRAAVMSQLTDFRDGRTKTYAPVFRLQHKNGSYRWVEVHSVAIRDAAGKAVRLIGSHTDITERKHAEIALEAQTRLLNSILDSMSEAVVVADDTPRLVLFNPTAERMFGGGVSDARPAEWPARYHLYLPDMVTLVRGEQTPLSRALRGESVIREEIFVRHEQAPDGIWTVANARPIVGDGGKILGAVVVHHDITDRKRAENEIRKLNAELEARVRDRTAQLEASNQELDAFAYSVSHDLRAPLRSIDGFSQVLLEDYGDRLDDQGKDSLNRVRASAKRMAQLIDDLLKLSRMTRGEMQRVRVDLSAIARRTVDELRQSQPERRVEVVVADGLVADGDPHLLAVALGNLLGNAWKFTGKRENARIEVGVTQQEGRPAYFVRDNGAGFDMTYSGKLFGAFQRLHRPGEFPGTGIGLATVKRIIHRHGGRIWAEATVDQGATFYFTLGA